MVLIGSVAVNGSGRGGRRIFQHEWDEAYGLPFVERVLKVKRVFRVSYRTVCTGCRRRQRMAQPSGPASRWNGSDGSVVPCSRRMSRRRWPPRPSPQATQRIAGPMSRSISAVDFAESRLLGLVRKAIEQDDITLARGAEVLGLSLRQMRELSAAWV